ncbi:MAG: sulfatase [Planctomycetes bacterium]|nr:sulfatase [Planctomycetota bacterium]
MKKATLILLYAYIYLSPSLWAVESMNVLFISVDDLRPNVGREGGGYAITPNIDQIEAEGLRFNRAYCQYPVCGPSRASTMTGLLPDSSGVYGFENSDSKVGDITILPQLLKNHGYATGRFGKVFNNPHDFKEAWDEWPIRQHEEGFTWRSMHFVVKKHKIMSEPSMTNQSETGDVSEGKGQIGRGPSVERVDYPDEVFIDDEIARQAMDFMKRKKTDPFFLAVGFCRPHLPFSAPERFWAMYDEKDVPLATNPFLPARTEDFMANNWEEMRAYCDIPNEGPLSLEKERELIQGYYATVSWVDYQIGRLLKTLEELKLREKTILVFWSDHGFHLGENGTWAKHVNWEKTNRVPILISVPGMKHRGTQSEQLVELLDLFPTVTDLVGLEAPDHVDGRSLVPLLENPERPWAEAALSQYKRGDKMSYSIRTKRYRYSEWRKFNATGKEILGRELYDLERDPDANVNLASDTGLKHVLIEHARILERQVARAVPRK